MKCTCMGTRQYVCSLCGKQSGEIRLTRTEIEGALPKEMKWEEMLNPKGIYPLEQNHRIIERIEGFNQCSSQVRTSLDKVWGMK